MQYAPNIGIWWRQGVCTSVAEIPSLHISSTDDLCLFLLPTEKKSRKIWPTSRSIEIIPSPNELWPHSIFPRWAPVPARHQVWFWRSGFRKFPVSSWHDPCHHVFSYFTWWMGNMNWSEAYIPTNRWTYHGRQVKIEHHFRLDRISFWCFWLNEKDTKCWSILKTQKHLQV